MFRVSVSLVFPESKKKRNTNVILKVKVKGKERRKKTAEEAAKRK